MLCFLCLVCVIDCPALSSAKLHMDTDNKSSTKIIEMKSLPEESARNVICSTSSDPVNNSSDAVSLTISNDHCNGSMDVNIERNGMKTAALYSPRYEMRNTDIIDRNASSISTINKNKNTSYCVGIHEGEEYELASDVTNVDISNFVAQINVISEADEAGIVRIIEREEVPATLDSELTYNSGHFDLELPANETKRLKEKNLCMNNNKRNILLFDQNGSSLRNGSFMSVLEQKCIIDAQSNKKSLDMLRKKNNCTNDKLISSNFVKNDDVYETRRSRRDDRYSATWPRVKKSILQRLVCQQKRNKEVPIRITPDGTSIYYRCDVRRKTMKG